MDLRIPSVRESPQSSIQFCVAYYIKTSCEYVVYKDKKEFATDMKNIYNVPNKEVVVTELDNLEKKRGGKYLYAYFHGGTNGMTRRSSSSSRRKS